MAHVGFRTFGPGFGFTAALRAQALPVLTGLWARYQDFRQRRSLAGLSLLELKDFGYPVDEAPADVVAHAPNESKARRRDAQQRPGSPR